MSRDSTEPGIGHNTPEGKHVLAFLERAERLNEDKKAIGEDIKELWAEAKGQGYDTKVMKRLVGLRSQDPDKRREERTILELYAEAIGMEV